MAKKYLKHVVTRDNQRFHTSMLDYVNDHRKSDNLLCYADHNSWALYEMIQSGFYCNWPNTNNNRYFIKAQSMVLPTGSEIRQTSNKGVINNYFGYLFLNADNNTSVNFEIGEEKETILAETGLLLICPETDETHSIKWEMSYELIGIRFNITPVQNIIRPANWIPF